MSYESFKTVDATGIGATTLVGYIGDTYPIDVEVGEAFFRVLNFGVENLEELLKCGTVTWPVKVHILRNASENGRGLCVIHDPRIPDSWYWKRFCEVCTPRSMWPLPQRLEFDRGVLAGDITITEGEDFDIVSKKIHAQVGPLKAKWTVEAEEDLDTSVKVDPGESD